MIDEKDSSTVAVESPRGATPEILSPEEAAAYLRLPVTTIRAALRRGELPGAMFCRRWRIRRTDVDALFATTRPGEDAAPDAPAALIATDAPRLGRPGRPRSVRRRSAASAS